VTLHTDASDIAIGAVLSQKTEDGTHVIGYLSHKLMHKGGYAPHVKEMLAAVTALKE
jgi:hypothetical protein